MTLKTFFSRRPAEPGGRSAEPDAPASPRPGPGPDVARYEPAEMPPAESDPLKRLWQQGRYAVIARNAPQWRGHPGGDALLSAAVNLLQDRLALVPEGTVTLPTTLSSEPGSPEVDVDVESFFLSVTAVTNVEFQRFVDAGAYDDLDLWPEELWPHLIELHDLTGAAGPRFWMNGRHNQRLAQHPVVGISWFEAKAYAQWVGLRLPTESEWQMAASWHIRSSADVYRRFPWGDAMDRTRCNLWASGRRGTVPVQEHPNGAAPNGVLQLVGNVWEWTDSDFEITDRSGRPVLGEMPMKSVRGGAFDTYFENQATSTFRTGQLSLARTHDTGFRCAAGLTDVPWPP
jgi:iron(II)-dependent oxidoreductase